ncbi:MAG: aminotransferase class IV [Chloroflexota bacterium]|nr:aminotransferase class IV [Chloroflexota bacterium]
MGQIVYLNGALLPRSQATISPFDHGFLYGYALFETMRSYSGHIFRLQRHLDRLTSAARHIGMPLGTFDLEKACYDTLQANRLGDARIRLTVSTGEGEAIPDLPPDAIPTVFVVAAHYNPLPDERYRSGFRAMVSSIRQNSQTVLSRIKSANYLHNMIARREAREAGIDEALLLNERGFLCEGSTSNVFLVSGGNLITPGVDSGCLPGITRQTVIELATQMGTGVVQREIKLEELLQADEAFLTNSILELMPLREVDGKPVGGVTENGERGGVTGRLMIAYRELVARELGA